MLSLFLGGSSTQAFPILDQVSDGINNIADSPSREQPKKPRCLSPGNPASSLRRVGFRPRLAASLPLSGNSVHVDVAPAGRLTKRKWPSHNPIFRKTKPSCLWATRLSSLPWKRSLAYRTRLMASLVFRKLIIIIFNLFCQENCTKI